MTMPIGAAFQAGAVIDVSHQSAGDSNVQAVRPAVRRSILVALSGLAFVVQVPILLYRNVNWDEFWFLAFVHDYARGTLLTSLQSFHVHVFGWLPATAGQEVDQIIVARAAYLVLLLGTCACVYRLARRMASVDASWFAVLCCAGYTNILYHGTSFRTDGLSVFLLMAALVLAQSRSRRPAALSASAVLVALALLVTIKSVLFLPTIGALLVAASLRESRMGPVRDALLFLTVLIAATLGLYLWHVSTLAGTSASDAVAAYLQASARKVVRRDVFFPGYFVFQETVRGNLIQWGVLVYAIGVLGRRILVRQQVVETYAALALALPLLSLLFYRNTFPYFFAFLMPPVLVLCAVTFDEWAGRTTSGPLRDGHLTVLAAVAIGIAVAWSGLRAAPDGTRVQREVIGAVHDVFPQPVPYIDRNGMIASFPKVGFFMSSWGLDDYRDAGVPVFRSLLRTSRPKLLLDNAPTLTAAFGGRGSQILFEEDAAALRESFVQYWGPIYVAGHRLHLDPGAEAGWEVLIAGAYRLESEGPVTIGGSLRPSGSVIELPAGWVTFRSDLPQEIVLHTSDAGEAPSRPPPDGPLYTGFGLSAPIVVFPR